MKFNSLLKIVIICSSFCVVPYTVASQSLSIDRIFSDPDLNGQLPKALRFSPDGKRVTFLKGKADDSLKMDVWEYNLQDKATRLLIDSNSLQSGDETLSDAEKARRERMRLYDKGIVDYQWSEDSKALMFPLGGDVYTATFDAAQKVTVKRMLNTETFETDFKFSPKGSALSFVRDFDLFIINRETGKETRLTKDAKGTVKNAVAEFVAQEEMSRYTGYWWSPDEKFIAFTQIDESPIEIALRYEVHANAFKINEERYPITGGANVKIKVGVVEVASGKITWMDIGKEQDIYIPRIKWLRDSQTVAIQWQSRNQQTLDLLFADVSTGKSRRILRETSKTWINLHDDLYFYKSKNWFIWSSERDGNNHLYLYTLEGKLISQLTRGNWQVFSLLGIEEEKNIVYFDANAETPLEKHFYSVAWQASKAQAPIKISTSEGWHDIELADDKASYIDRFSSHNTPPQVGVYSISGQHLEYLEENKLDAQHPFYAYKDEQPPVEFGTIKASDKQELFYKILKPKNFDANKKYPVIVHVYGGPTAQQVRKAWDSRWGNVNRVLANHGYIVFTLDNRGSGNRSRQFTDALYKKLGTIEVDDQVTGVNYLKTLPYVDGDRVGIYGWSYGGYMTLMSLLKEPDTFKVGVAGAPVTDWALYDTHYTERYMGTPQDNVKAYAAGNVINFVDGFNNKLLLVHGMADDNVIFNNSTLLMQTLQDKDIQFDLMTYPGQTHRITSNARQRHLFKMILRYFDQHLKY